MQIKYIKRVTMKEQIITQEQLEQSKELYLKKLKIVNSLSEVNKMLDEASKTNPDNEIEITSFGVSLRLERNNNTNGLNGNHVYISIMDHNGYSIIELTPKEIKELKKFVSKL